MEPFFHGENGIPVLRFSIQNHGNTDVDLLMVEAMIPSSMITSNYYIHNVANVVDWFPLSFDGQDYKVCRYSTHVAGPVISLRPTLTRSMGKITLDYPKFGLKPEAFKDREWMIYYQVHARNYDTLREQIRLSQVPELR